MSELEDGDVPISMQQRRALLRKVCAVLNAHDIDYFLTCGTLLGYIRDNDFVEWDTDIDMGVFDMDEVLRLEQQFGRLGLRCELNYRSHCSPKLAVWDSELDVDSRLHVDLFEFEDTEDGVAFKFAFKPWYIDLARPVVLSVLRSVQRRGYPASYGVEELLEASSVPSAWKRAMRRLNEWKRRKLYKPGIHIFEPFTCVTVLWSGLSVRIPSRPIDHLRLLYGDEWHIPKPNYSQSKERQRNIRRVRL